MIPVLSPNDPYFNNVSLLLSTRDGIIKDYSKYNHTITANGNAAISSSQANFGNKSIYFDGNGDYLTIPQNNAFNFGYGNFTVEFWIYFNSITQPFYQTIYDCNYGAAPNLTFQTSGASMAVYMNGVYIVLTSSVHTVGAWVHYALVRNGTAVTLYCNGASVASTTYSGDVGNSSVEQYIGGSLGGGGGYYLSGYISTLRITAGIARPIQVPTQPFPAW